MNNFPKFSASDDEDDLELLRLKALETLKRKNAAADSTNNIHQQGSSPDKLNQYVRNKRRRTFGPHIGRGGKNFQGHFNRVRNTNLISITPVSDEIDVEEKSLKFTLSSKTSEKENSVGEGTSKFNRYDNSDKSETETEEEEEESDSADPSPGKLERADSLEALMQELDDEIKGKPKSKEEKQANGNKVKTKRIKKKRLASDSDKNTDYKTDNELSDKNADLVKQAADSSTKVDEAKEPINNKHNVSAPVESSPTMKENLPQKRQRSRSPFNKRTSFRTRRLLPYPNTRHPLHQPMGQTMNQFQPPMFHLPPYNQMYPPPISQPPPYYERPISPLSINTESLTTATMAPLSPRSAAFVLQNKAIIEKRRRSPRRSYSRSFSRSLSRSPRRSLTPPRRLQRRSISPRRLSRSPRRFSPRRRSLSPKRKSLSPRRRTLARKDGSPKNKQLGRNRPSNKGGQSESIKDKEIAKEKEKIPATQVKEETSQDPVLEARKRKFETNQIGKKAGIIRLKPKEEKLQEAPVQELLPGKGEEAPAPVGAVEGEAKAVKDADKDPDEFKELEKLLNEDLLLESDDIIDHKVEDIFSDEESNSDNEGRFKVKQKDGAKIPVLSFSNLMNGTKEDVKAEPLQFRNDRFRGRRGGSRYDDRKRTSPIDKKTAPRKEDGRERKEDVRERKDDARERKDDGRERKDEGRGRKDSGRVRKDGEREKKEEEREREEKEVQKKVESLEKSSVKQRISLKKDRPPPSMDKRFERKIEIKIKNPSKYEKSGKERTSKSDDRTLRVEKVMEIQKEDEAVVELKEEVGQDEVEEVVDEDNLAVNEGDLRAQLSRKRAGKLHKAPAEVSSRLLQFALEGAVYRKTKKKSKDKSITDSDGKLPIHLRLGLANQAEIFEDVKVKRKSRKRKNREVLEKVYYFLLQDFHISNDL